MIDILSRAGCFVAIIFLGMILRRIGFFKREDFNLLSKIVIRITLPAAIVTNLSGREFEYSLFVLIAIGFAFGVVLMTAGYFLNHRRGNEDRAFGVLNMSGVNVSNFVLPFAQGFLGPEGVLAVSLFDVGNGVICLGGAYCVADMVKEKQKRFSMMPVLRALGKSVPLVTYVIMFTLCMLHIRLPEPVADLAGIIGSANPFLAMLMLGVGFQIDKSRVPEVLRILVPRYLTGLAFAALCWFLLPVPAVYRQTLVIPFLGPVSSAVPAFTAQLKGDYELSSAINSFSILISVVLIIIALLIIL
ncbi:MAG: AEC family transporter [Clostridia bacterium]|nr:AEC family transporter [Clostridia bacterium]